MNKKTMRALPPGPYPKPHNLAQKLRRIRNEVSLMLSAIDGGLQRIEAEKPAEYHRPEHER